MDKAKKLIIPEKYSSCLSVSQTEKAIKQVKDFFQNSLSEALNLQRVSAPLFVLPESGLNDNLNGVERPVSFDILAIDKVVEIVQSLAKWKRMALGKYGFDCGEGLYTDMNAIRRDEELSNLHSVYVDQWDWEKIISRQERSLDTLKGTVRAIYYSIKATEDYIVSLYPNLPKFLPEDIHFISSQELLDMYPQLSPKEREDRVAKDYGAVFVIGIGKKLSDGTIHDGRAPDYDDWELNGDILLWYPVLNRAFEISSMGIRVDEVSLKKQLEISGCEDRAKLKFHSDLLNGSLPLTMGGGIGQSRLCMFLLKKAHVGEVQASVWPEDMLLECAQNNITLL